MKRCVAVFTILAAFGGASSYYEVDAQSVPNPPRIKFKAETPLQLPLDMHFGEAAGVAVNSKGHVFVYSRGNVSGSAFTAIAAQLFEFDVSGKFVREIGRNLYGFNFAHSVRIDSEDNIWVVDKASNMIMKLSPEGRVLNVHGRKDEAGGYRPPQPRGAPSDPKAPVHRPGYFAEPTDVAFDSAGNAFISDGYINSRVAKINKDGDWVKSWGERGTGPSQFLTVHGIATDNNDNVYVADRGNGRIQVFDSNGKFLRQFSLHGQVPFFPLTADTPNPNPLFLTDEKSTPRRTWDPNVPNATPDKPQTNLTGVPGSPLAICINRGKNQFLYIADVNPSRIYKVSLDGKLLGMIGDPGAKLGQFRAPHGLECPDERTIWVAEVFNWRVQKLTLQD
jgi:hypothetical protein